MILLDKQVEMEATTLPRRSAFSFLPVEAQVLDACLSCGQYSNSFTLGSGLLAASFVLARYLCG